MQLDKDDAIQPGDVPQNDFFDKKDMSQYPQPADADSALEEKRQQTTPWLKSGQYDKSGSKADINEQDSDGSASAFGEFIDNALKNDDHLK